MTNPITAAVGERGVNDAQDVGIVQHLLNLVRKQTGQRPLLVVDGKVGPKTIGAVKEFQQKYCKAEKSGRMEPGGETITTLNRVALPEARLNDGYAFLLPSGGSGNIA